jgi:O-antigen ligase
VIVDDARFKLLNNPFRKSGFKLALAFVFLRFSFLHEIIATHLHFNPYLLLIVGAPATVVAILAGAVPRTFRDRGARLLGLFVIWMAISVPFSNWVGDSARLLLNYGRATVPIMFIIGGMAVTLEECFQVMGAIALGGAVNVLYATSFSSDLSRLNLGNGSIGNSNEFAAHVLFVLPFALWVALTSRVKIFRLAAVTLFFGGLFIGSRTGSRGALLGIAAAALFAIAYAKGPARIALVLSIPILAGGLVLFLPQSLKNRYSTLFSDPAVSHGSRQPRNEEAIESTAARVYLLKTSLAMTMEHPLLGVGPNQFLTTEGGQSQLSGKHGLWQVTHNTYTQVSSEDGIPALLFFLGSIFCVFRGLLRIYRKCQGTQWRRVRLAAFFMMLSMVGFCVAIFFLSMAYSLYIPAIIGLTLALDRAVGHEMQSNNALSPKIPVVPRGFSRAPQYAES